MVTPGSPSDPLGILGTPLLTPLSTRSVDTGVLFPPGLELVVDHKVLGDVSKLLLQQVDVRHGVDDGLEDPCPCPTNTSDLSGSRQEEGWFCRVDDWSFIDRGLRLWCTRLNPNKTVMWCMYTSAARIVPITNSLSSHPFLPPA